MLLLIACVSKGDHELIQVQLDATRTALSAKNASCYQEGQANTERIAALELELDGTRGRLEALDERYQQLLDEVTATRSQLATLITSCSEPPEEKKPKRRRGQKEEEPPVPLVQATALDVLAALELRSRQLYEKQQRLAAHQTLVEVFEDLQAEGRLEVVLLQGASVVRIPVVQIFNEGRVSVSPRGEILLQRLAAALEGSAGMVIQVAAHTDDRPLHTAEHDSSWELGFDQAMTVLRMLQEAQVPASLSAASFAGERPIADNQTAEGRKANSRIELVIIPEGLTSQRPPVGDPKEPAEGEEESGEKEESPPATPAPADSAEK